MLVGLTKIAIRAIQRNQKFVEIITTKATIRAIALIGAKFVLITGSRVNAVKSLKMLTVLNKKHVPLETNS